MIRLLLTNGADPNAKSVYGLVPFYEAIGCVKKVEFLNVFLEHGADLNLKDKSAVQYAVYNHRKIEFLEFLLEKGADINACNSAALRSAVGIRHFKVVKFLIDHGANININYITTPLHIAVKISNNERILNLLLSCGAHTNSKDKYGRTPLFYAVYHKCKTNIKTLFKFGTNIYCESCFLEEMDNRLYNFYERTPKGLNFLLKYLIKLKVLNLLDVYGYKEEHYLLWKFSIDAQHSRINYWKLFEKNCGEEVEKMKTELICLDRNITFLDVMKKTSSQLTVYFKLTEVRKKIREVRLKNEFPLYASLLKSKMKAAIKLANLLTETQETLGILLEKYKVPLVVVNLVVNYLCVRDLENLSIIGRKKRQNCA